MNFFYPLQNCGRKFNTGDDQYARICVPDKVKNMNAKVFDLMLRVNETRFFVQHKLYECKYGLNESVWNY